MNETTDNSSRDHGDRWGVFIRSRLVEHGIASGKIDVNDKTDVELKEQIDEYIGRLADPTCEIVFELDHRPTLIAEANKQKESGNYEIAGLLLATWAEHWANAIIRLHGFRRGLTEKESLEMLREAPLRAKLGWLLKTMVGRTISGKHRTKIIKLSEHRNAFAHYKWHGFDPDCNKKQLELEELVNGFDNTISYLKRFESKHVYFDSKKRIQRLVSTPPALEDGV